MEDWEEKEREEETCALVRSVYNVAVDHHDETEGMGASSLLLLLLLLWVLMMVSKEDAKSTRICFWAGEKVPTQRKWKFKGDLSGGDVRRGPMW